MTLITDFIRAIRIGAADGSRMPQFISRASRARSTTLEARFAKTRSLKQGMMQVLLTGRIRLT